MPLAGMAHPAMKMITDAARLRGQALTRENGARRGQRLADIPDMQPNSWRSAPGPQAGRPRPIASQAHRCSNSDSDGPPTLLNPPQAPGSRPERQARNTSRKHRRQPPTRQQPELGDSPLLRENVRNHGVVSGETDR
jgi:hypothetical protein